MPQPVIVARAPTPSASYSARCRWDTCVLVRQSGMELCCRALAGTGETIETTLPAWADAAATGGRLTR